MIEHGTPEWVAARLGKLTASRVHDALATKKDGGWYAARRHYMIELVAERLTGMQAGPYGVDATFIPASMQWGQETEPQAVLAYERGRGVKVEPAGFIAHPLLPMAGASPDGLVGDDGMIQVKCPESRTHAATLIERTIPPE